MSLAISRAKMTGDPGLFGDIFSGIKGAIGGGVRGFLGKQPPAPLALPGGVPTAFAGFGPLDSARRFGAAAQGFMGPGPSTAVVPFTPAGAMCPTGSMGGYHLNKSDYFLRSGEFVPKGSKWVKNRKRNPANARATSRAISRVVGAKRYATSLSRVSIRKHKSRH